MDAEGQLIERIARVVRSKKGGGLRLGIGDDSALIRVPERKELALSCDAFIEEVHFLEGVHPPQSIGYKSLVRATSDLAAMGATPRFFLMSLALPENKTGDWLDAFLKGLSRAARELRMRIVGGDTTKSSAVSVVMTAIGEISGEKAVKRSGARPGDSIFVSGALGRAQLGLQLIREGFSKGKDFRDSLAAHLYPRIPVRLGEWLARRSVASAMMDVSDGLSTDLARLCEASGVGAKIIAAQIPRVLLPKRLPEKMRKRLEPLQMALHGGDDYALLFTVPEWKMNRLRKAPGFAQIAEIGSIKASQGIVLVKEPGASEPLLPRGWDPFRKK